MASAIDALKKSAVAHDRRVNMLRGSKAIAGHIGLTQRDVLYLIKTGTLPGMSIRDGGELRLWRLAVVESTAMTAGQFLVGATMAAQIFDREDAAVEVATQHADFRLNGKVAIIGEERLALTVTRPEAFVYGQFELGDEIDSINTVA